jgi:hypothetical protein
MRALVESVTRFDPSRIPVLWFCRAAAEARDKRNLNGAIGIAAVLAVLGAMVAAYSVGGPLVLMEAISKSGLPAAFSLIFVSEIGDKVGWVSCLIIIAIKKFRGLLCL